MPKDFSLLQENIGYTFKDKALLAGALSHSSYVNEKNNSGTSNERLEFLGDSVLGFLTAEYFYESYSHLPEGELTRLRAAVVCERSLFDFAKEIKLGDFLFLGKGEMANGGTNRPSILADAFEALLAAIYLDSGMEEAKRFAMKFLEKASKKALSFKDYKTTLQEVVQKNPEESLEYVLVEESGPDHNKSFTVEVHLNSNVIGRGKGKSKKNAEQEAAREALELMGL
ncbi:MAG TPA: ribonuclease III [Clostridiales bacterium]|nr:ribonuclease III [Clostridiales bacterium]HRT81999.1 ribonuclease III [Oscillospiraceae bacterium]